MKKLSLFLVLALTLSLFQSCKKDELTPPAGEVAPELPPQETFIMAFTDFESSDTTELAANNNSNNNGNPAFNTYHNWFYAAGNIVIWNTVLVIHTAIPTLSFFEAFKHDAVYQGDATWLWAYNFTAADGSVYEAELSGKWLVNSAEVQWDMYISKQGGFSDVNWYSGITANDRSYARWTLNHKPFNPTPLIDIDFKRDLSTGVESIRYTNIIPNSADNGDYIEYRNYGNAPGDYNRQDRKSVV